MKNSYSNIYLAMAKAVVDTGRVAYYSNIYSPILSEPMDYFLVRPIKRIKMFCELEGDIPFRLAIVGYEEVITGKKIITRSFERDEFGSTEIYQHDVLANVEPSVGDVYWHIDESHTAIETIGVDKVNEYLKHPKEELQFRLNEVRVRAVALGAEYERAKVKKL